MLDHPEGVFNLGANLGFGALNLCGIALWFGHPHADRHSLRTLLKTTALDHAVLKSDSKCSFTACKLRFFI